MFPVPLTLSAPHLTKTESAAAMRNVQSKSDPKTSYAGIVENKFVSATPSPAPGGGGGGKDERIWTIVDSRYIP